MWNRVRGEVGEEVGVIVLFRLALDTVDLAFMDDFGVVLPARHYASYSNNIEFMSQPKL